MATYDAFRGNVLSFDIETTGIDPGGYFGQDLGSGVSKKDLKPRIWATAFHNPESDKIFEQLYASPNREAEANALSGHSFYGKNQVWKDYIESSHVGMANSGKVGEALNKSFLESGFDGGMMLIQNAKFENRWISHIQSEEGVIDFMHRARYSQPMANDNLRQLYVPHKVSELKREIDRDSMSPAAIDGIYDKIIEAYKTETEESKKAGKFVVGDLMDFTAATFTKAVSKGLLNETYLTNGQNVELLSKVFLGEEETHAAGSDARQQSRLLEKMLKLRDDIQGGKVSEADYKRLALMNSMSDHVVELSAAKGALGFIESIENGAPNVSGQVVGYRYVTINDSITGTNYDLEVPKRERIRGKQNILPNYLVNTRANQNTETYKAIKEVHDKYGASDGLDVIQSEDFKNRIRGLSESAQEAISGRELEQIQPTTGFQDIDSFVLRAQEKASDMYNSYASSYKDMKGSQGLLSSIMPDNPKSGLAVMAAVGGVGALWAASQFNDDEKAKEFQLRRKQRQVELSPDATFKMYTPLNKPQAVPYGQARADWESRIGHHEY